MLIFLLNYFHQLWNSLLSEMATLTADKRGHKCLGVNLAFFLHFPRNEIVDENVLSVCNKINGDSVKGNQNPMSRNLYH